MRGCRPLCALGGALLSLAVPAVSFAVTVPSQFVVEDVAPGAAFNTPVNIAFFPGGRMLVAEKRGRVYTVVNGVKNANPLWQSEAEVLDNGDRGLLGVAVDPRYNGTTNRWIYLLYTVDPDSNSNDNNDDAFGRLIRIQVSAADSNVVDYSTRQVLFGTDWRHGPVSASPSHTIGSLRFGSDGSLLVSVGDGAQFSGTDQGGQDPGAFGATKTDPNEDIGAFRSLDITSLAGKMLRLNPDNGQGYPSNPYWDGDGTSVRSRVWAYGLRNPYRFCRRPATGGTDPALGTPGTLYIGDVGYVTWEEMDVLRTKGLNYGWPCFEGLGPNSDYQGASPAHNGCSSFGTPTNPLQASAPLATWHHSTDALSVPPGFHGNTSIGGAFYTSNQYPATYRNQYFFGDYGQSWVKVAVVDGNDNLVQILPFGTAMDGPVDFNIEPGTGNILYVAINVGQVRRIRYTGSTGGNSPPIASMSATPLSGPAPLVVSFSAAGSIDPDGDPLTYTWVFGDGSASGSGVSTSHTYSAQGTYTAQLTVSDGKGGQDVRTATISVGGTAGSFPTTPVLDNFNRANGPIGGSWTGLTTGLNITNNELTSTGAASSPVYNGQVFGADQEAYVTFNAVTAGAQEHDLMLKVQGTSYTGGHIEVRYTAPRSEVQVSTYTATTQWVNRGAPIPVTFAAGDQLGARALANGTIEVYKNGVKIGSTSAGTWPFATSGGRLGMTFDGITASRLDNFGGGNVVFNTNTKPTATITSPANNSFYYAGQTIQLTGTGSDAQTPSDSLGYEWIVDLWHNTHVHPGVFTATGTSASYLGENHDDGTGVWEQVKFVVTDKGGLTDTAKVNIYPEIDLSPSQLAVTPSAPQSGLGATFSFVLSNAGRMPAPISHWVLRAGSTLIAQGDTLVPALSGVTISRPIASLGLAAGTYALRATADSLATVVETNETNNAVTVALTVNPGPPNAPPVANATATTATSGVAPLTVGLSSAGSSDPEGDPITFAWAFGDGGTATAAAPSHTYTTAGTFNAILTVSDNHSNSAKDTVVVTVAPNLPPIATATATTATTGVAPITVGFSSAGSSDPEGGPLTYAWAFGDGGTANTATASHLYNTAGTFNAILTVTDNVGGTGKDTVVVTVTPPAGSTFPATAVLDNFNRANGALGAPWENSVGFSVNANQMKPTGAYPNTCWNGAIFSANQEAFITFSTLASGGVEYILMLKMQGQFWYNGHIEVNYEPGSAAVRVSTYAPTGGWVTCGSVPVTFASGDRYGARALANGNVTVYKNGTAVGTVSVSGWSFAANGGRIGMSFTTATASAFDDFGGGDAPAAIASAAATPASGDPAREEVALDAAPRVLELSSPYPNPSGGDVSIRLSLPAASDVGIAVLDLQGREVWRESARRYEAGRYTLRWSGRTAAGPARPGVYLMRVSAGETTFMRRVAVIR